jgi:hypothetical protein
MTLDEIAAAHPQSNMLRVPAWALGCVERRSITFATGLEDTQTRVYWVQAHGMTGDIRIHPGRPQIGAETNLHTLDRNTLSRLASIEGGVAITSWSEPVMSWADWIGFQPYDKYPEPGIMRRIGDCMIEFAPSGAYVEDWRFLPSAPGLLAGLRLVSETDTEDNTYPRSGGLVIAGDHAIRTLCRYQELPDGTRCQDFVATSNDPAAALERVFQCVTDYLVREEDLWRLAASTDPRREGSLGQLTGNLKPGAEPGTLIETVHDTPGIAQRLWHIDSLEANVAFHQATPLAPDRLAWLDREADTLIEPVTTTTKRKVA